MLWLWHFLYSVGPHPLSILYIYTFVVSRAFMAGAASQAWDADSSRAPGLTSGLQGSVNVHRGTLLLVPQWQCISSFVIYIGVLYNLQDTIGFNMAGCQFLQKQIEQSQEVVFFSDATSRFKEKKKKEKKRAVLSIKVWLYWINILCMHTNTWYVCPWNWDSRASRFWPVLLFA